jgi:hypothetical protein
MTFFELYELYEQPPTTNQTTSLDIGNQPTGALIR